MERPTEAPVTLVLRLADEGQDEEIRVYRERVKHGKALRRGRGIAGSRPVLCISGKTPQAGL